MAQFRKSELSEVATYPMRLYSNVEISKLLRISPVTWRIVYQPRLPPIKAGTHKTAHAFWTDVDVVKAIDMRFPDMDQERRSALLEQLHRGRIRRGPVEVP